MKAIVHRGRGYKRLGLTVLEIRQAAETKTGAAVLRDMGDIMLVVSGHRGLRIVETLRNSAKEFRLEFPEFALTIRAVISSCVTTHDRKHTTARLTPLYDFSEALP